MWFYVGINLVASASNSQLLIYLFRSLAPMMVLRVNLFTKAGWKRTLHLKIKTFLGKLLVCFLPQGKLRVPCAPCFSRHAVLRCLMDNLSGGNPRASHCAASDVPISQNTESLNPQDGQQIDLVYKSSVKIILSQ